jgi:hypothetical protein
VHAIDPASDHARRKRIRIFSTTTATQWHVSGLFKMSKLSNVRYTHFRTAIQDITTAARMKAEAEATQRGMHVARVRVIVTIVPIDNESLTCKSQWPPEWTTD